MIIIRLILTREHRNYRAACCCIIKRHPICIIRHRIILHHQPTLGIPSFLGNRCTTWVDQPVSSPMSWSTPVRAVR